MSVWFIWVKISAAVVVFYDGGIKPA